MCGFCGFINTNAQTAQSSILEKMNTSISHRGPDGFGMYVNENVALGHRRLSIIDLSNNAQQPFESGDGRFVLVYNGVIYNYRELRKELEQKMHRFQSNSDAEVVLCSYIEWGESCLNRFNGVFAFCIYDKKQRVIFCARDRYGAKPFYYAKVGNIIIFASEQKAIFAHPAYRHEIDADGLLEYFTFQNFITDRTLEKGVKTLPAGCSLLIHSDNSELRINRWWDFRFEEESDRGEAAYTEELDHILSHAIEKQLVSDVEIGCFLSGGMDSGSITCIASRTFPHIKTFTCSYDMTGATSEELHYDERRKAEIMARHFQTEHYEMILQYSDIERAMQKVCWHVEEPRVGPTYTNFYISQLASKFVKVAFSGSGGDELFGGYPWRYYRGMTARNFDEFADGYYVFWQRLIPSRLVDSVFSNMKSKITTDPKQIFKNVFNNHQITLDRPEDYINHSLYFEAKTFLQGMLAVEDKLSMAHGLESRVPMLDNDLVDFAQKLPVKYKLNDLAENIKRVKNDPNIRNENYYMRTNLGKHLLRKTMEKYIPQEIDRAEKQGFSAPDATWFRNECRGYVESVIFNNNARIWSYLNPEPMRALVEEHMDATVNRRLLIWSLMYFEQYLNQWYA